MLREVIQYCDICGDKLNYMKIKNKIDIFPKTVKIFGIVIENAMMGKLEYDICDKCFDKLYDDLKNKHDKTVRRLEELK